MANLIRDCTFNGVNPDTCPIFDAEYIFLRVRGKSVGDKVDVNIKCPDDNSLVKETLNQPGNNRVLMIDAKGVDHASMVGDQIAQAALTNNWNGIIVDGFVRDIEVLKTLPIGIYAKGSIPQKTNKQGLGSLGVDIFVGGILIQSGNWIYADPNGWVIAKKKLEL